jgi:uncharacterized membrane protein YtjA (UPF0391 family)
MVRWAIIFFIIAIIAALFGFGGVSGAAAGIARVLFVGFLIITAIALVLGIGRGSAAK